jgi:hypothetical protein
LGPFETNTPLSVDELLRLHQAKRLFGGNIVE